MSQDRNELVCRFAKAAECASSVAMRDLERSVCGCAYGSTSWTTRREAERIAELLELGPDVQLLDVGAGSGWPGLYLAQLTGCDVVLVDLPLVALRIALARATDDGLSERCEAVAADGAALPFLDGSFDALSHSDVLCCTPDKLGVLRACRRVARHGSRMVFTSMAIAPSLADPDRRVAMESGPKFVDTEEDYAILLGQSGWCLEDRADLTVALLQSMRNELDGMRVRGDALTKVFGSDEFAERLKRQRAAITAIDAGFLRRELFVARANV